MDNKVLDFQMEMVKRNAPEILAELYKNTKKQENAVHII